MWIRDPCRAYKFLIFSPVRFTGLLLFAVMSMNGISLIVATLVMNLKKQGDERFCTKVPRWILCICRAVTCLCKTPLANPIGSLRFKGRRSRTPVRRRPAQRNQPRENDEVHHNQDCHPDNQMSSDNDAYEYDRQFQKEREHLLRENNGTFRRQVSGQFGIFRNENGEIISSSEDQPNTRRPTAPAAVFRRQCLTRKPTLRYPYRRPKVRQWKNTVPPAVREQWYFVADVVDRCAFVLSLIAMVIMLTTMMCIMPKLSATSNMEAVDGAI